jgi:Beta-propeller repeat/PASTA domain
MDRRFEGWRRLSGLGPRGCTFATALLLAFAALSLSSATSARVKQAPETVKHAARSAALDAYRGLPLAFVRNDGQLDRRVRYSTQIGSMSVFLTGREAVVALDKGERGLALRLAFLGASPDATIAGADRSPGRANYFVGSDPARWQTNLPTYEEVVYRNLWPGIDMGVRGRGGQLKYEFRLAPGADPTRIRLRYRGQRQLSLGPGGVLRVETALGLLRDSRPVSYQLVGDRRVAVSSMFALGDNGAYGFALGAYDRRSALVIDPGLRYSTFLGGGEIDDVGGIAVGGAGSVYVTGFTASTDLPTTAGAFDMTFNGGTRDGGDAFVAKVNASGSALAYATYLGGSGDDEGHGIAVDRVGSAYLTGPTSSTDFPATAGALDRSLDGDRDAFVTKLSATGSALAYSTYLGGSSLENGAGIAVDGAGRAYIAGSTRSTDFPTTADALDSSFNGAGNEGGDAFVTELDLGGSALAYSTYLGGRSSDYSVGIAVDRAGSAYVRGFTTSTDFPTTAGAFDRSYNDGGVVGGGDAFATKLNAAGSGLAYSTYLGGGDAEYGGGIAIDRAGRAFLTGFTYSKKFPTTVGALDRSCDGADAFVTKLAASGSALAYSTCLGGSAWDETNGIAVDRAGSAYVTGLTLSRDFPTTSGAFDRSYNGDGDQGGGDGFVTKLSATGSALVYSTYLGGRDRDGGGGSAVDSRGNAYIVGGTASPNFPTSRGAVDRSHHGTWDVFIAKLDLIAGPVRCWVPHVVGITVAKAKRTIRTMDCSVGRIRRVRSTRVGRVVAQSPRAGAVRRRGFKVNLIVGRR